MKLKYEFAVREIVGEYILIPLGQGALELGEMISTSETGATIVQALGKEVTRPELLQLILDTFEIDRDTAERDLDEFLSQLKKLNLLVGE